MKSSKAHFFFALSIFFASFFLFNNAKAVQVFGKVTDTEGKSLSFVTIYQEGTTYGTISNEEGHYFLELSEGVYQIVFRSTDYQTQIREITITSDQSTENRIRTKY